MRDALEQADRAGKLAANPRLNPGAYVRWLRSELRSAARTIGAFLKAQRRKDVFAVGSALRLLSRAVRDKPWEDLAVAHTSVLNRLDSYLTALQLERGDPADILQNVRWQEDLYGRTPALRRLECAAKVSQLSRAFIHAFAERGSGTTTYRKLIEELLPCFKQTADALPRLGLGRHITEMTRRIEHPTALQKTHRDYLLALERTTARGRRVSMR